MDLDSLFINFDQHVSEVFAVSLIVAGVVACFFGYRLFKMILIITGILGGGGLVWTVLATNGFSLGTVFTGALVGALLGSLALFYLFFLGVFLFGCSLGLFVALVVLAAVGTQVNILSAGIFALVVGLVAILIRKGLIVASTSFTGSWSLLSGATYFTQGLDPFTILLRPNFLRSGENLSHLIFGLWLVLGISGIIFQLRSSSRKKRRR